MNDESKPCPLCGEIPFIWKDVSGLVAECGNPHCALFQEPICFGVWQKCPIEDKLQARIAVLERQLNDLCPIGGLGVLETWQVEKMRYMEHIAELEAKIAKMESKNNA